MHIVDQRTSFDGKRIIFIVTDGNGNYNWHMLNLENNTVAPFTIKDGENTITPTLVRLTATNWSGNNNLISVQLGNTIYLTDYNGTVFDKIQSCEGTLYHFNSNYLSMHSWSRGTNEMVYFGRSVNNKSKLYKYNPATKSSQEITAAGEWRVNSAGSPSAPETSVYHPTLTPDGKGVLLFEASTTPQGGDLVFSTSKCMVDLVNNIKTTSSAIQYYKEFGGNIHVPLEFGAWGKWDTTSYCYSPVKGASGYVPGVNYFYKNLTELTGSPGYIYRHEGGQWYIDSSPDGNKFVINNYGDIKILDKQGNVIQNVTPSSGVGVWLYDCRAEWR